MASQPRINSALVAAIRMARMSMANSTGGQAKISHFVHNQHRPDKAYTTDRAKRNGMANAASGRIFVTTPSDHFGPITAEYDPVRNRGVLVGESWDLRMDCRQWGIHYPHVSGIAGQAKYGAQSVVLSGGYEDDEDHGEWFLYTGRFVYIKYNFNFYSVTIHMYNLLLACSNYRMILYMGCLSLFIVFLVISMCFLTDIPSFSK